MNNKIVIPLTIRTLCGIFEVFILKSYEDIAMPDTNILHRPLFVVFDGLDGAGKTTQLKLLAERLRREGHTVTLTAEPTDAYSGKLLRQALCGDLPATPTQLAALFLLDRIGHNTNEENGIAALLEKGHIVLCDRYYYSSMAYQGADTDFDWVAEINLDCPDVLHPDGCILFDIPAEVCMKRIEERTDQKEIYETVTKQDALRERFARVAEYVQTHGGEPVITLNADGTIEEVAERVYNAFINIAKERLC